MGLQDLRPDSLNDFVGQEELKEHLEIILGAAQMRGKPQIIYCLPDLRIRKNTLANIVAGEMGVVMHSTSGPALERAGDLAAILTKLEPGDVLFIDEIHRLSKRLKRFVSCNGGLPT